MPADALTDLTQSFLDLRWHLDPVEATGAGLRAHDHRLGRFTTEDLRQHVAALNALMSAVEQLDVDDVQDEIDRTALLNEIRFTVHRFAVERPHERDPGFWLEHLLEGVYLLLVVRDRSREARAAALAERLGAARRFLDEARVTLDVPAGVLVELALRMIEGGKALVAEAARTLPPADDPTFPDIVRTALEALEDFRRHLDALRDRPDAGGFALGEEGFNVRLHTQHALRTTANELWRYGERLAASVERDLEAVAAEIAPGTPWPDLLDRLRAAHPSAASLVEAYADAMRRARRFVEERELVAVPDGELDVLATPSFLQPMVPFAAYQPPGAYSEDRRGLFYVTTPDGDGDADRARQALRDHCHHEIPTIALHEGYPGHHLQFLTAQAQPRILRRLLATPVMVEGWAMYCEEMMGEEGFFASPEERFFQRVALLWRALRILADVGLHTRGMSFEEAVQLLSDRVHFDRGTIEAEVRRYCARPSYQMAYAVGLGELKALRDDYRASRGGDYSLRAFHEAVLAYGGYPVSLARWGMGL